MRSRVQLRGVLTVLLSVAILGLCAGAKGQDANAASSARIFPQVGPDLKAIKRDSSGRYYILAKPANVVWIFAPDGKLVGKVPNDRSSGAIRYAVDIDLNSAGDLYVADRGANAVEIFGPDGALIRKIPVFAPISVVALPDDQVAVVSLRSKHLVSIFDRSGDLYNEFGERSEVDPGAPPEALTDPGEIYGDGTGHIYFAFTSGTEPMVRKYDGVGYVDYTAALPVSEIEPASSKPEDRVEFGLNVGQMNVSDQLGAWASVGSSGTVRFGSSMGTGFGQRVGRGFMRPAGGGMPGAFGNFSGTSAPGAMGLNGATFSGEGVVQDGEFHFSLGAGLGRGRSPRNRNLASNDDSGPGSGQASLLQFTSGQFSTGSEAASTDDATSDDYSGLLSESPDEILSSPETTTSELSDPGIVTPSADVTLQPGMFAGGALFHPHGGGFGGARGGGAPFGGGFRPARTASFAAPGGAGPSGAPGGRPFGAPGHFVFNTYNVAGSVRVNLDRPTQPEEKNPKLTAVGTDPATGESWVAIGSQLIHLGADGSLLGSYYMATPDGTPLHPTAILVERDRLLLADDPLGVFSFARPDHSAPARATLSARAAAEPASH